MCENSRRGGGLFCMCPNELMFALGLTADDLTYLMAYQLPYVLMQLGSWTDPDGYCGSTGICKKPKCIPLPL